MSKDWHTALSEHLNTHITGQTRLSGGDFAASWQVRLDDGRTIFVKTHKNPPLNFFTTEAQGLSWLRDSGTVNIPQVLFVSDAPPCLALEWVDEGPRVASGEEQLGQQLAALHQQRFACFGRPDERTTGSLAVPNSPHKDWASFYRACRLLPLLDKAQERSALSASTIDKLHTLCDRLPDVAPPPAPPSLVHGDLWAGNRIVDSAGLSWLIDPAAHGNHREFDLAMMRLFGGYESTCFSAYNEAYPLDAGWQQRIPLMQLAPLIVHAIKFGGHYAAATDDAVSSLL